LFGAIKLPVIGLTLISVQKNRILIVTFSYSNCAAVCYFPTVELRHLKYFVSVAEERNFNRAAARLRVSQPAVSRQIADLEEKLGVPLFVRNGHGVELTSEGETMLGHARDLLRHAHAVEEAMRALRKHQLSETLVIGYVPGEISGMLTSALRTFEGLFPQVAINLVEMAPRDQVNALIATKLDVALVGSPCPRLEDQVSVEILKEQLVHAVVADYHRFAGRSHVSLKELAHEEFIGICERTFPGRNEAIVVACRNAGFSPKMRHFADGLSTLFALVAAGKGVTLAPREMTQSPPPQTVFLKLKPAIPRRMSVAAFNKGDERESVKKLIELCKRQIEPGNVKISIRLNAATPASKNSGLDHVHELVSSQGRKPPGILSSKSARL
jgi:LysR family transcriptional regulator, benzoate and cis,cis-muconate-responsive activator of ben and cat genes